MSMKVEKKLWIAKEIRASIIVPLVFLALGWIVKIALFAENAYPVDYDLLDSYMWADKFFDVLIFSTIICILYHCAVAFIGAKTKFNSQGSWLVYLLISVLLAILSIWHMWSNYPEESACSWWMVGIFLLDYIVTFLVSTWFCPKHWDFVPYK